MQPQPHLPPFSPVSPEAGAISNVFLLSLAILAGIMLLVTVLTVYASIRFRARKEDRAGKVPKQVLGHTWAEIGWTVGPTLIVAFLFVFTVRAMILSDPAAGRRAPDVRVVAHQWWWELHYPASDVVTANEPHLPVGRKLLFRLESADVIHDFWVPRLGRKMDATPGHVGHVWLQADHPGVYLGSCNEYCGVGHAWMRIRVFAQTPQEFQAWLRQQLRIPPPPTTPEARAGAKLFLQMPCANCHRIAGTPAQALVGPDLTHLATRQTLGAGAIDNSPRNLGRWLADPQAIKPGVNMPNLRLTPAEIRALTAYLWSP